MNNIYRLFKQYYHNRTGIGLLIAKPASSKAHVSFMSENPKEYDNLSACITLVHKRYPYMAVPQPCLVSIAKR